MKMRSYCAGRMRVQRRQVAAFVFALYLFDGGAIIGGIWGLQFDGNQIAARFRLNDFGDGFGVVTAA